MSATESVLDLASPGPAMKNALDLATKRRKRIVWRMDAGFGTFGNFQWLLDRHYHVLGKGFSSNCAHALAKEIQRWYRFEDHWIARAPCPFATDRQVTTWLLRRQEKDSFTYNYYITTLHFPSLAAAMRAYQQRGGAEIEQFRNDKQGLHLSMRRKRTFNAQQALILLTDLAHNLLADFYTEALQGADFHDFGLKRIVRDLLAVPGCLSWQGSELRVGLQKSHPNSKTLLECLVKYAQHYELQVLVSR